MDRHVGKNSSFASEETISTSWFPFRGKQAREGRGGDMCPSRRLYRHVEPTLNEGQRYPPNDSLVPKRNDRQKIELNVEILEGHLGCMKSTHSMHAKMALKDLNI